MASLRFKAARSVMGGKKKVVPRTKVGKRRKVKMVMDEWKAGKLRSGSKKGPVVKSQRQAIAIALSQSGQSNKK